ncbi:hypothetical protein HMPREF3034_01322 [Prevotella sp. DNF00663]|nr:hypothetical protein HMPREF3034_01322 [Prevotella sp. DNF00663]
MCLVYLPPCPATRYGLTYSEKREVAVLPPENSEVSYSDYRLRLGNV